MYKSTQSVVSDISILSFNNDRYENFRKKIGTEAYNYLKSFIDIQKKGNLIISSEKDIEDRDIYKKKFSSIIDLIPINRNNNRSKYIEKLNQNLAINGIFIGRIVTIAYTQINHPAKVSFFGSLKFLKGLTTRKNQNARSILQKAQPDVINRIKIDILGRLCFNGFEIISEREIGWYTYFVAKKTKVPIENYTPSSSPIIKLKRIGKNGKLITIFKLRTMYPYSEFLQEYIYKNNNLESGGKFKEDNRISKIGSFMRRYWIDEIPMLINLLRGDIKLFGVRPLSQQYFKLYSKELQQLRVKFKPGLIPPYYADLPTSFEDIMESEKRYLTEYQQNSIYTDLKYLFKALYNILIRCKRSK